MERKKKLYFVSIPDISCPDEPFYAYVYAFSECHALNMLISKLHEYDGISLERLSLAEREVYEIIQFIK